MDDQVSLEEYVVVHLTFMTSVLPHPSCHSDVQLDPLNFSYSIEQHQFP